jgi:hypothetical protein
MPWVLGIVVLILVALATHAPRVCRDDSASTPALSDVSVVAVAAHNVPDPCGDTARLDVAAVCPTRLDATDPMPTGLAVASIPLGCAPARGPATAGTPAAAPPCPPMGLAVADLAVTRI